MNRFLRAFPFCFLLIFIGNNSYASETLKVHETLCLENKGCIKAEINEGEGILHIVISGTQQGEASLIIKNSSGETILSQQIKCWNESTVIDLSLEEFQKGTYAVSFQSSGLTCDTEFSF